MKPKGYRYEMTLQQIREYSKLTPRQKLNWLEEANRFSFRAIRGKTKIIWEMFRSGTMHS